MSADTWEDRNNAYLSAALAWLHLLLDRHTPASAATTVPAPAVTVEAPVNRQGRLFRRRTTVPLTPLRELGAGDPDRGIATALVTTADPDLDAARQAMEEAEKGDPPPAMIRLGQLFGLSAFERCLLLLCAAMELDPTMSSRYARAQGDGRLAYPTFALAMTILPDPAWDAISPGGTLRRRLLRIDRAAGEPLVTGALSIDERITNYLKGLNQIDDRLEPWLTPVLPRPAALAPSQQAAARTAAARWAPPMLIELNGVDAITKPYVAAEAARRTGLSLFRIAAAAITGAPDLETLARLWARESVLLGAALYVDAHEVDHTDPAATTVARFLDRTDGMLLLGVRDPWARSGRDTLELDVDRPSPTEQAEAWAAAAPAAGADLAGRLAGQFDLDLRTIQQTAAVLSAPAGAADEPADRLWDACLAITRPALDSLAQRMEPKAGWDDIVLPPAETALLHSIADQVAVRTTVYQRWGFAAKMSRGLGISALFAGPSGTGKTMAAEVLAGALRLGLYRIDLSAVVSKYIGETEKNLRRLFDAAESGAALLFFDEADALFGKRSEVKDSHDRYANIEINYLLQRIEAYRGLAILATNMKSALDPAFLRRLRFVVPFPFPGTDERRAIWAGVFPPGVPLDGLDLDRLAKLPANGASIHNIALGAAFAAAHAGDAVTMPRVLAAVRTEFTKLELPISERELAWTDPAGVTP
ncbi:ATP-binding protein [Jidongwangia harbinensis]|uniref:ATP-binding protein n=1 Tax=Jidongwangia harbinensis TaxID=2878561 RepID=UPI001CDA4B77|nr:ATP-binding protein [Jidongwangia harbinensis]MCA2218013.1 ATP-binding protein [Jidongwangia harbinensis]